VRGDERAQRSEFELRRRTTTTGRGAFDRRPPCALRARANERFDRRTLTSSAPTSAGGRSLVLLARSRSSLEEAKTNVVVAIVVQCCTAIFIV